MGTRRQGLVTVAATAVAAFGASADPALAASSSNPVAAKIKQEARTIRDTSQLKALARLNGSSPAELKKAATAFAQLKPKFDTAATAVSKVTATTSAEKRGQSDWVKGVREAGTGLAEYATALDDAAKGDKSAAKRELKTAAKTGLAGDKLILAGEKLLGLVSTKTGTSV